MACRKVWTKEETTHLIYLYKSCPEVWDSRHIHYKNREKRSMCWHSMGRAMNTTSAEVQRKIHNLRNQVSQELQKIKKRKDVSGTEDVHRSTWPHFGALQFIVPSLSPRESSSNLEAEKVQPQSSQSQKSVDPDAGKRSTVQKAGESAPKKTRRKDSDADEDRDTIRTTNTQNTERDEFTIFGEHVAFKLRNLKDRRSQSIAQFEISRILFQIEMGNFKNLTHFDISTASPHTVDTAYLGTVASQIPPSDYSTLSPVVLLQSAPSSVSPPPQVPKLSPHSLHSDRSVAEDTETKSENGTVITASICEYTEESNKPTDRCLLVSSHEYID